MHWRQIVVGTLLGGFIGVIGQFVVDCFWFGGLDYLAANVDFYGCRVAGASEKIQMLSLRLIFQEWFLAWLIARGQFTVGTVSITMFLGALAAVYLQKNRRRKYSEN